MCDSCVIKTIILKFIIIFTLLVSEPVLDDDDWTQVFVPCMFPVSRGGKSTDILYLEVQEEVQILVLKTTPVNVQVLIQFLYSKVKMYKLSNVIKVRK